MNSFTNIISELSELLQTTLLVSHDSICAFKVEQHVQVQIEEDPTAHRLLLLALICEIPAGKFRENTLKAMLIANGNQLKSGIFSYIKHTNTLAFHRYLYSSQKSATHLASALAETIEVATNCYKAIQNGQTPNL